MAVVETACAGARAAARGATIVQLRAPNLSARELEREALRLASELGEVHAVVSSRCDIALAAGLSGVNLPERDISVGDARRLLPRPRLVGRSVHSPAAAREAESEGADFVIFGPVWESPSHPGGRPQGIDALRTVAEAVAIPVLAIGGVTAARIDELLSVCAGYAAISLFQ